MVANGLHWTSSTQISGKNQGTSGWVLVQMESILFNGQSSTHSTWTVWVCMYNLPPWKCMKKKYITMCMLVQGPKQPGTDLNLYLQLVKVELQTLWKEGVNTWDATAQ